MIKRFKYLTEFARAISRCKAVLLATLSVFLLSLNCSAIALDSTEDEKLPARMTERIRSGGQEKINALLNQATEEAASEAMEEQETPQEVVHTGPTGQETYLADSIKKHEFNKEDWKKVTEGLSYNEKAEKPKPKKKEKEYKYDSSKSSGSWFQIDSGLGQMILFLLVAVLLAFVLFKIFSGQVSNTKVGKQKTYNIQEIEDAIHETDLERYLREAIANKEFRIAVRIYYLMAIKALSEREWIKWKKDKTNNQYLFEMSTRPNFAGFRDITRLFEFAWYGEMTVDEKHFQLLDPKFKEFLKQINTLPD